MSKARSKYDNYATYSSYGTNSEKNDKNEPVVERFSNQPPPQMSQIQPPPQTPQSSNEQPIRQNSVHPFSDSTSQEFPHRVKQIDTTKMYELLSNPAHFFVQQQPLRMFIKVSTSWCKPCVKIAPEIKALSNNPKYAAILFLEVNGDDLMHDDKLSAKLRVSAVPSFFGFVAGKQVGFEAGTIMNDIIALCDKIVSV